MYSGGIVHLTWEHLSIPQEEHGQRGVWTPWLNLLPPPLIREDNGWMNGEEQKLKTCPRVIFRSSAATRTEQEITPFSAVCAPPWQTYQSMPTNTPGMSLTTGRQRSQLILVSGSFVGKRSFKIKALCIWQLGVTYLFDFKGSAAFLHCFTELCFQCRVQLMDGFVWNVCVF